MRKKTAERSGSPDAYWQRRVRSKAFKRDLTALIARELESLSAQRVKDVVDAGLVRTLIREWNPPLINRDMLADLIIRGNRRIAGRLRRRRESLLGVLDPQLGADIDAILNEDVELSADAEGFVANVMQQEFVRRLFTDVIFTAIVSFNRKVNPLFGAIAVRVMEEQIKGFIHLFMPMLQQQAIAFAVDKDNQRILLDFTRSIIRRLLEEPLRNYATVMSPGQTRKMNALIRKAVASAKLDAAVRKTTLAAWDDVYRAIRDKQVGDLLQLASHADRLAARCVELILPALTRPGVLEFVASEMATATATKS